MPKKNLAFVLFCIVPIFLSASINTQTNAFQKTALTPTPKAGGSGVLAFSGGNDNYGLYVMDADGSNTKRLTDSDNRYGTSWSPDSSHIIFAKGPLGKGQIYSIDQDGKNLRQLTNNSLDAIEVSWSSDGRKFAFESGHDGDAYVMNADGTNVHQLIAHDIRAQNLWQAGLPIWSPDSKSLLITARSLNKSDFGAENVFVTSADSETTISLTHDGKSGGGAWSPDGKYVVFISLASGIQQLYIMGAQGGNVRQLTNGAIGSLSPQWSPDGKTIAFISGVGSQRFIDSVNIDGSDQHHLSPLTMSYTSIAWAPDGRTISFIGGAEISHIYTINADGSEMKKISSDEGLDFGQSWSPDGKTIAFISDVTDVGALSLVDADGSNLRVIATSKCNNVSYGPMWSPDGTMIMFGSQSQKQSSTLCIINVDGSSERVLKDNIPGYLIYAWSPDSKSVAYSCEESTKLSICVIDIDSSKSQNLMVNLVEGYPISWSLSSNVIAFISTSSTAPNSIQSQKHYVYVVDPDGKNLHELTANPPQAYLNENDPIWSPNGKQIAFISDRDRQTHGGDIYVSNIDGSGLRRLTYDDKRPSVSWSTDGKQLLFSAQAGIVFELFIMNADGTHLKRLTTDASLNKYNASWRP